VAEDGFLAGLGKPENGLCNGKAPTLALAICAAILEIE